QGAGRDALAGRQRVQQVHRPDLVAALAGLGLGHDHGRPVLVGESLDHRWCPLGQRTRARRACFLWAACRDTPRISAISCQDHPCSRALSPWSASSCSSSLRRAATARSPVYGSELSAAAARAGALSMVSIYVDNGELSTWVDTDARADYEALTRAG